MTVHPFKLEVRVFELLCALSLLLTLEKSQLFAPTEFVIMTDLTKSEDELLSRLNCSQLSAMVTNSSIITPPEGRPIELSVAPVTILFGSLATLGLLWHFCKRATLRTPFGMYLVNLLFTDALISCIWQPILLAHLSSASWKLGYGACVFRQYLGWTLIASVDVSHFLIALNRLWAVAFPISYRSHHNVKAAIVTCSFAWLFINACTIPTAILVTFLTPADSLGNQKCTIRPRLIGVWGSVIQAVLYDFPIVAGISMYPVICYKSFGGSRQRRRVRVANIPSNTRNQQSTNQGAATATTQATGNSSTVAGQADQRRAGKLWCGKPLHGSSLGFVTLTLTTVSATVCLAPNEAWATALIVFDRFLPGEDVVKVLQMLTVICDPVLIVLANPELREAVRNKMSFCCSRK